MTEYIVDLLEIEKTSDRFKMLFTESIPLGREIVRCGDCKHQGKPYECWLEATEPDEFCSRGKRKEGGE